MRIEDSVFLITGGGSGLGLAAARQLLGQGGKVLLLDINAEAGQRIFQQIDIGPVKLGRRDNVITGRT